MIEGIYNFLELIGFHHPIHPIIVHLPMGMVVGAVAFSLADKIWKTKNFDQTAFHCIVLALISVGPAYIAGLLDWQHVFGGDPSIWIKIKLVLGAALTVVLIFTVIQKMRGVTQQRLFLLYLLSLGICGGLGYSGGELLYGG
jgi:uncharacterized membrane protein